MTDFARDERGVIAIFVALAIPIIVAISAFAIDYGYIVSVQAQLRNASDAAALAAVTLVDSDQDAAVQKALEYAEKNMPGAENGAVLSESDVVVGHWSNSSKTFTSGQSPINAVQVTTRRSSANGNPIDLFFGPAISVPTADANSKSVAALLNTGDSSAYCFIALSSSLDGAMTFGASETELDTCGVKSNSSSTSSLTFAGSSAKLQVTDAYVSTVGGVRQSGDPELDLAHELITGADSMSDPHQNVDIPSFSGCDNGPPALVVNANTTLSPGVYCGGLTVNGSASVTFDSGTYIILDGDLKLTGSSQIDGEEVTFVFTGTTNSTIGTMTINGSAQVEFTAPTTGNFEGIIMYQDRNASTSGSNRISGSAQLKIDGSFYFPRQEIVITGSSQIENDDECANFIGHTIAVRGNAQVKIECDKASDFAIIDKTGGSVALLRE